MSLTQAELNAVLSEADLLKTKEEVEVALDQMAVEITKQLDNELPIVYAIMNGGLAIAGQLLTRLHFPLELGYMHATGYRGDTSVNPDLQWLALPSVPMQDRTVLIVDDIFDEGHTLAEVINACKAQGAKKIYTAVLVDKVHDRKHPGLEVDFCGMQVEDRYVFGYGMDYRGFWRNAPGIYALKEM